MICGRANKSGQPSRKARWVPLLWGQLLDPLDFLGLQTEIEDFEIGAHVVRAGGPRQRHHPDVESKSEDDLADGSAVAPGDPDQFRMRQCILVGGEQGEALVDQSIGGTEFSDATIPALDSVAAVLDE